MSQTSREPSSAYSFRYNRVIGPGWAMAIGLTVTVGLGVFTLLGQFTISGARQAMGAYLIAAIIAIPFLATFAERALAVPGRGGVYSFVQSANLLWLRFFTGWFILGGYAVLVALFGYGVALHTNLLLTALFAADVLPLTAQAVLAIAALAVYTLFVSGARWRWRTLLIFAAVLFVLLLLLTNLTGRGAPVSVENILTLREPLLRRAALIAVIYWGMLLTVDVRARIRRPVKTLIPSVGAAVGIGVGLGLLATLALMRQPAALVYRELPLYGLLAVAGDALGLSLPAFLLAFFGIVLNALGITQILLSGARLLDRMADDGFLPSSLSFMSDRQLPTGTAVFLGGLLAALLVVLIPVPRLVMLAAILFFWVSIIIHGPDLLRSQPNLASTRRVKLPFHPLIPGIVVAISLLASFFLLSDAIMYAGGWLAAGGIIYLGYARMRGKQIRRQQVVVADDGHNNAAPGNRYRVMVCVHNPDTAEDLVRFGLAMAAANDGELLVLRVVVSRHSLALKADHAEADEQYRFLAAVFAGFEDSPVPLHPIVRLAPTLVDGILISVREEACDLVIMGGTGRFVKGRAAENGLLDQIMSYAACDVAVLHGTFAVPAKRIVVATAGGQHTVFGYQLAQALATQGDATVQVITVADNAAEDPQAQAHDALHTCMGEDYDPNLVASGGKNDAANGEGENQVQENGGDAAAAAAPDAAEYELPPARILRAASISAGVIDASEGAELLIVGASPATVFERPRYHGLALDLAAESTVPTLIVRRNPARRYPDLDRLVDRFVTAMPALSETQRGEVVAGMRQAATPNVDFFVLILLSSVIASYGLLQNSGAVIIGAMLVAPLMSPILAVAMGMVIGSFETMVTAIEATLKGLVLAVIVGILAVIVSPITGATTEILARTEPNLLDLMIALASGAAAGYAISRKEVAAALPGVAIAAALVPPLCVVGYSIGVSNLAYAAGALLLFATNFIAIIFAAALTFLLLGFLPPREERNELVRSLRLTVLGLVVILSVLGVATYVSVAESNRRAAVQEIFDDYSARHQAFVSDFEITGTADGVLIGATLIHYDGRRSGSEDLEELLAALEAAVGERVELDATLVDAELLGVAPDRVELDLLAATRRAVEAAGGMVADSWAEVGTEQTVVRAIVHAPPGHNLDAAGVDALSADLSAAFSRPVLLSLTILPVDIIGVTPTPLPTRPVTE